MKVLIVNKFLYPNGGSETYIFKLGEQLEKMGHEVQYFGMEHEGRIAGNHAKSYTSDMDFHTGKLKKLLYPFKIIYSLEARTRIREVLRDMQPDVVHLNNFNFQLTPSVLYEIRNFGKKTGKKINIVYTAHDSQLVCPNHLMQRFLTGERCQLCVGHSPWNCTRYQCIHGSFAKSLIGSTEAFLYRSLHAYRMIDTVICPSSFLKEKLDHNPDLCGKTVVMHNFADRLEVQRDKAEPYVLYFGRFSEEKGMKTLLNVVKELPEIPFVFVGNGPLENMVNQEPNIKNMGFLSGTELYEMISGARFSLFTSECYENCPFAVMESIMYGTPVIGADIGGTSELLKDGENGELFESGNVGMLREKTERLWKDEALLKKYTVGCEDTVFDTAEEYCNKLLKLFAKQ